MVSFFFSEKNKEIQFTTKKMLIEQCFDWMVNN